MLMLQQGKDLQNSNTDYEHVIAYNNDLGYFFQSLNIYKSNYSMPKSSCMHAFAHGFKSDLQKTFQHFTDELVFRNHNLTMWTIARVATLLK